MPRAIGLIVLVLLAGCVGDYGRETLGLVPDGEVLRMRVESFYAAEARGDADACFLLLHPEARTSTDREELRSMFRDRPFRIVEWRILSTRLTEGNPTDGMTAAVLMDVTVDRDGVLEKEPDQTDYWVRLDDTWFWTWRGWPSD